MIVILSKKDARESKLSKIFSTLFLGKELGFSVTLKKILPYIFLQYVKTSHWSSHIVASKLDQGRQIKVEDHYNSLYIT